MNILLQCTSHYLNSPHYGGIFFKNYFILVTKPTTSFIEEKICRKNIVRLMKAKKIIYFRPFDFESVFFNKKCFLEVREETENTRTYKLSTSSYTHVVPNHSSPSKFSWFKRLTIQNILILYFKFTQKQVIQMIRME